MAQDKRLIEEQGKKNLTYLLSQFNLDFSPTAAGSTTVTKRSELGGNGQ